MSGAQDNDRLEIEAELRRRRLCLAFSPKLEALYRADTLDTDRRLFMQVAIPVISIYFFYGAIDAIIHAPIVHYSVLMRGVISLVCYVILFATYAMRRPLALDYVASILVTLCTQGVMWINQAATEIGFHYSLVAVPLIILVLGAFRRIAVPAMALATVSSTAVFAHGISLDPTVSPTDRVLLVSVMAFAGLTLTNGAYWVETDHRRFWLLSRLAAAQSEALRKLTLIDAATGLGNRRGLAAWIETSRPAGALGALMLDIDHFKRFNDLYGHAAGDRAIALVAGLVRDMLGPDEAAFRMGGEEFLVLMPGCGERDVEVRALAIRAAVEAARLAHAGNPGAGVVTVSIGIAHAALCADAAVVERLAGDADEALYRAKATGRNRVAAGRGTALDGASVALLA